MEVGDIRANIRRIRRSKGITQKDMAIGLFMDERTYAKVERGEKKSMDVMLLLAIADILETELSTLLLASDAPENINPVKSAPEYIDRLNEEVNTLKEHISALSAGQEEILRVLRSVTR